jgi:hypothetical protein
MFKMPHVEAGMSVLWSPGNGSAFVPALVTKVGINSITVALLRSGATSFVPKDSVRHITDPGFRKMVEPSKSGCWEFRDQDVLLARVAVKVLGPAVAFEVCPGFESMIAVYTPEHESLGTDPGDDPEKVGF